MSGEASGVKRRTPERHDTKRDRLARLVNVLMVLNAHPEGVTAEQLAAAADVSRRQAYRDLHALDEETGIAVWNDRGRWGLMEQALLPSLKLTVHEAMAFFVSARLLAKFADEHDADFSNAFLKLAAVLPPMLRDHLVDTLDRMADAPVDETFRRHVRDLTLAWAERRIVQITYDATAYDPARATRTTRVHPYLVEPSALTHALYLVGYDEERRDTRTFKIERIRSVSMTPQTFEPPPDFRAGTVLAGAWDVIGDQPPLEVVLGFSPAVATRVAETRWHRSQALERRPDGSLIWRATVSGPFEIRIWVLGWGHDVEVLAPPSLRDEVAAIHRRAAARYGDAPET